MTSTITVDSDGILRCPNCNDEYLHLEEVLIGAREEDRTFNDIKVNAVTGQVRTHDEPAPVGRAQGLGRRHRIAVRGYCETCGSNIALVFTQHKGVTFAEWSDEPGEASRH